MSVFKCKMCGGTIEFEQGATIGVCDSCGTKQTLPRLDDEPRINLYDRANHFRRNNEFDKAEGIYEQILNEDVEDAEAYWSLVLCHYGIEYVEDPKTHKRVPTVNRAQFTSIFDDDNYKSALKYADGAQRVIYEEEANAINEIQKGILAISLKEEPFDIFICYKETDQNGRRTPDSVLANDLYYQLKQEGFKVFFSRITLEDKLGTAYEPYIFAALNSAKVMVVLGTKPEYFNAVWVKNEWSRYLTLVRESGGKKTLIPAYRDMDPYDLPDEFSHLQAQDMNKLGFMQDLIRGIKKIVSVKELRPATNEPIVVGGKAEVEPLLERVFLFLEDGEWGKADAFCEQILNQEPKNARAYIGKLMAELHVHKQDELANCEQTLEGYNNYQKAIRFGDEKTISTLNGYNDQIKERIEYNQLLGIYNAASAAMSVADTETKYLAISRTFNSISGFRDSDMLAKQCIEKAEACRKNGMYASAISKMNENTERGYEEAISIFNTVSGWRDTDDKIRICQNRINEIKIKEEKERLEKERKAEERRIAAIKAAKRRKMLAVSFAIIAAICTIFVVLLITVIIPEYKYNKAIELSSSGDYEAAYELFNLMQDYKDCKERMDSIRSKYNRTQLYKADVGSFVYFGSYEQDGDMSNGKEDIEWIVVKKDGNSILVVSKYVLDIKMYNETLEDVTWETCSLRKWLNGQFIQDAFSKEDRNMIIFSSVASEHNPRYPSSPGKDTIDQVFILSYKEANNYLYSARSGLLTEHMQQRTANGKLFANRWWLRTQGIINTRAIVVDEDGSIDAAGIIINEPGGVRPAMWIDLNT